MRPRNQRFVSRRAFLYGGLGLGIGLFAGCGPESGEPGVGSGAGLLPAWIGPPTTIRVYYPVAVGGNIATTFEQLIRRFMDETPGITVEPVFSGNYQETLSRILAELRQGLQPPAAAVILATDLYPLLDANAIMPLDPFIRTSEGYLLTDFYPAFLSNSQTLDGATWSIPFQRSTPVLYYNRDLFRQTGLNPDLPPASWRDLTEMARVLTVPGERWGIQIPASQFAYWMFQCMAISNGQNIVGEAANQVTFNAYRHIEALQWWVDLAYEQAVHPPLAPDWATTPDDFLAGRAAMIWHTTGNLKRLLDEADFEVGVAFVPGSLRYGVPTGGGNLYMFRDTSDNEKLATWQLMRWLSEPQNTAWWSIETGYIATRLSAYSDPAMQQYASQRPQALVARDQVQYGAKELAAHKTPEIQGLLDYAVQRALGRDMAPDAALNRAQSMAMALLEGSTP